MAAEMETAAKNLEFEKAAVLRDQIKALRSLSERGGGGRTAADKAIQTEVFFQDHAAAGALKNLQELLELPEMPQSIEGIDIAHFQGEATVGSLVCFIDGRPFKNGYRRYRIKSVTGVDDYRSIQEVIARRYREAGANQELYPDVILIDGGPGQLSCGAGCVCGDGGGAADGDIAGEARGGGICAGAGRAAAAIADESGVEAFAAHPG